ncbi:succinate/glutarate-semialdehyde dehydrogenase-like protein [Microdochium nivale]|nr:succinate/glutarate-semialdehyde dehydrogenase-like protein [Microdochium nivale]
MRLAQQPPSGSREDASTDSLANCETPGVSASTVPLIIDGADVVLPETFDVIKSATNKVFSQCSNASAATAQDAIDAAVRAFPAWSETTIEARRDILIKAAAVVEARAKELQTYMEDETGADDA